MTERTLLAADDPAVRRLLDDAERQGLGRCVTDPAALARVAAVLGQKERAACA